MSAILSQEKSRLFYLSLQNFSENTLGTAVGQIFIWYKYVQLKIDEIDETSYKFSNSGSGQLSGFQNHFKELQVP